MWWAALSTDIKKSSVNWNGLPTWMEKAVQYHNTILETCVKYYEENNSNGTTVQLLPNAPEGDAYTYIFTNTSLKKLKKFVINLGIDIQHILREVRRNMNNNFLSLHKCEKLIAAIKLENENNTEHLWKTYNIFQTKKFYGGIFIRIGIAFSDNPPIPYTFERYRGGLEGEKSKSYRGSVVSMAEKAEEKADYDFKSININNELQKVALIKECYMEDDTMKFKDVYEPEKKVSEESDVPCVKLPRNRRRRNATTSVEIPIDMLRKTTIPKSRYKQRSPDYKLTQMIDTNLKIKEAQIQNKKANDVKGFCVFVEYKQVLTDSLAIKNPYTKRLINEEYIDIHAKADECIRTFINGNTTDVFRGGLVKQKRDNTSMFVILERSVAATKIHAKQLYKKLAQLLATLPSGSSIGVAYGNMKEITMERDKEGTFTDYFQESVNLAARMVMRDWSFSTSWGITENNTHKNRLAFTSKETKFSEEVANELESSKLPIVLENVPLSALNAGGNETILCISSKFTGWKTLKVGDTVKMPNQGKGTIIVDNGDKFDIKSETNRVNKDVPRSQLTYVKSKDNSDWMTLEDFKKKLKL